MDKVKKLFEKEIVRYVFAGGCTTAVNLVSFMALRLFTSLSRSVVNIIAISLAIIFAFFVNKFFVFISEKKNIFVILREFISFVAVRLLAMLVEVVGTNILCDSFMINELASKIIIQAVVLVMNYIFGKCFVFKKEKKPIKDILNDNFVVVVSFALVAFFMLGVWIVMDVGPFGGCSLTYVDSLHQYLPFYSDYYDKLVNEGSLFYTWDIGLGSNMLAIIAYYISCPLNFIVILFGKSNIYMAMSFLISLKIALSGATFASYMGHKCKDKNNFMIIAFSVAYALSNYVIGYSWNLMWMDVIMILPLIMKGYDYIVEDGDYKLYTFAMFYGLLCNYYISFMVCIFLVLQFFLTNHHGIKKFFIHGFKFAGCSILAAMMSAFLLIPAYLGLNTTSSATRTWPKWSWYGSIWEMVKQLFIFTKPIKSQTFDGGVNLYCGTICFALVFIYLLNTKISLFEKIKNVILLALLMVSFNNVLLNYIWHGLHDQYGIPNRFSFLFIFIVLAISCEALVKIDNIDISLIFIGISCGFAFLIWCNKNFTLEENAMLYTELILAAYGALMVIYKLMKKQSVKLIFTILIVVLCVSETCINGIKGYESNGSVDMGYYFEEEDGIRAAIDSINIKDKPYRAELVTNKIVDEPIYYNLKSVSLFGSTVSSDLVDSMHSFGFYSGANEFLFDGANPVSMSALGIRYLFRRQSDYNPYDVTRIDTVEDVDIYQNEYALSLGYMVNDDLLSWDLTGASLFDRVNNFVEKSTGVPCVYTQIYPDVYTESDNCTVIHEDPNGVYYSYERTSDDKCEFKINFDVTQESSDIYIYANSTGVRKIRIYINDEEKTCDRYQNQICHVGHLIEGDKVTIEYIFNNTQSKSGTCKLVISEFNYEAFELFYNKLAEKQMDIKNFKDGYVLGSIDLDKAGTMFTSIPYDKGWTVYVDGKKAEIQKVSNAFIALKLSEGHHEIEFKYFPDGLKQGLLLSILGWGIMAVLLSGILSKLKKAEKNEENTSHIVDQE